MNHEAIFKLHIHDHAKFEAIPAICSQDNGWKPPICSVQGHQQAQEWPNLDPNTWFTHLPLYKMAAILADDNFKCIFSTENDRILIHIALKFVPRSPIDNKPAMVEVMAWHQRGNKPIPEPMLTQFTDAYMWH